MSETSTPSQQFVAAASRTENITDSKGRVLRVRDLLALDQMRLLRAVGPAQATNQPYFHMVECAAMVTHIGDTPCPMPLNERQIDAAVERLGDEGMAAVMIFRTRRIQGIDAVR